jgi:hypothetical protein
MGYTPFCILSFRLSKLQLAMHLEHQKLLDYLPRNNQDNLDKDYQR